MYQIKNLPDGSTEAEERRRREAFVRSKVGPVGTEEGHRDRGTGAQPRVSCGSPKPRQGIGPRSTSEEHLQGAPPRPRNGTEDENQGKAEKPRKRTDARPKVSCGALSHGTEDWSRGGEPRQA
jgi:hypothetical protein